jgi:hypothetical protein
MLFIGQPLRELRVSIGAVVIEFRDVLYALTGETELLSRISAPRKGSGQLPKSCPEVVILRRDLFGFAQTGEAHPWRGGMAMVGQMEMVVHHQPTQ